MTYGVTDRQQAAMIVAIREFYRYFDTCLNVSAHTSIQVRIRYRVHYYIRPLGNGRTETYKNIIMRPLPHV